jgi:hypothetical protein
MCILRHIQVVIFAIIWFTFTWTGFNTYFLGQGGLSDLFLDTQLVDSICETGVLQSTNIPPHTLLFFLYKTLLFPMKLHIFYKHQQALRSLDIPTNFLHSLAQSFINAEIIYKWS